MRINPCLGQSAPVFRPIIDITRKENLFTSVHNGVAGPTRVAYSPQSNMSRAAHTPPTTPTLAKQVAKAALESSGLRPSCVRALGHVADRSTNTDVQNLASSSAVMAAAIHAGGCESPESQRLVSAIETWARKASPRVASNRSDSITAYQAGERSGRSVKATVELKTAMQAFLDTHHDEFHAFVSKEIILPALNDEILRRFPDATGGSVDDHLEQTSRAAYTNIAEDCLKSKNNPHGYVVHLLSVVHLVKEPGSPVQPAGQPPADPANPADPRAPFWPGPLNGPAGPGGYGPGPFQNVQTGSVLQEGANIEIGAPVTKVIMPKSDDVVGAALVGLLERTMEANSKRDVAHGKALANIENLKDQLALARLPATRNAATQTTGTDAAFDGSLGGASRGPATRDPVAPVLKPTVPVLKPNAPVLKADAPAVNGSGPRADQANGSSVRKLIDGYEALTQQTAKPTGPRYDGHTYGWNGTTWTRNGPELAQRTSTGPVATGPATEPTVPQAPAAPRDQAATVRAQPSQGSLEDDGRFDAMPVVSARGGKPPVRSPIVSLGVPDLGRRSSVDAHGNVINPRSFLDANGNVGNRLITTNGAATVNDGNTLLPSRAAVPKHWGNPEEKASPVVIPRGAPRRPRVPTFAATPAVTAPVMASVMPLAPPSPPPMPQVAPAHRSHAPAKDEPRAAPQVKPITKPVSSPGGSEALMAELLAKTQARRALADAGVSDGQ